MRRRFACVAMGAAALGCVLVGADLGAAGETGPITVISVKGSATVKHADATKVAAVKGLVLKAGDVLTVSPGGAVDLTMGDGNALRVSGGSTFKVGGAEPKKPTFDLLGGDLLVSLGAMPPGGKVVVRTPTGVAGVEGTAFRVHVEAERKGTEIAVRTGTVTLASVGEPKKHVAIGARQTASSVRWPDAVLRATGTGVPPGPAAAGAPPDAKPVIVASVGVLIPTDAGSPEAAEAVAEQRAHAEALTVLANRLARRRIDAARTIGSVILAKEGTLRKVADYAATAAITARRRTDDGRFLIDLTLDLKGLADLVGAGAGVFTGTIREVGRVEYGKAFGGRRRLMTEGAARRDAQRKLVERIHGVVIDATTTVKDLAAADDTIRTRTSGVLRGARVVATRYFADGAIEVAMEVAGKDFVTALDPDGTGRLGTHYLSTPAPADLGALLRLHGFAE